MDFCCVEFLNGGLSAWKGKSFCLLALDVQIVKFVNTDIHMYR